MKTKSCSGWAAFDKSHLSVNASPTSTSVKSGRMWLVKPVTVSFWKCHSEDSETKWVRQWSNVLDPCHIDVNFRDYYQRVFCSSYVVVKAIRIQESFSWSGLTLALLSSPSLFMQHVKAGWDHHCIAPCRWLLLQQEVSLGPTFCFSCHCSGIFLKASVASNWKQDHHELLVFTRDAQWPTNHFVSPQLLCNLFVFFLHVINSWIELLKGHFGTDHM